MCTVRVFESGEGGRVRFANVVDAYDTFAPGQPVLYERRGVLHLATVVASDSSLGATSYTVRMDVRGADGRVREASTERRHLRPIVAQSAEFELCAALRTYLHNTDPTRSCADTARLAREALAHVDVTLVAALVDAARDSFGITDEYNVRLSWSGRPIAEVERIVDAVPDPNRAVEVTTSWRLGGGMGTGDGGDSDGAEGGAGAAAAAPVPIPAAGSDGAGDA
eukprot:gene26833-41020_t